MTTPAAELVARCFAARTAAHIAHLSTHRYSAHIALNEFYDGIVELADSFCETYQGHFGMIDDFPNLMPPAPGTDSVAFIKALMEWASTNRTAASKGATDLANIIDEIAAHCARSIYKLTNLK
jgi:hypothetical protein